MPPAGAGSGVQGGHGGVIGMGEQEVVEAGPGEGDHGSLHLLLGEGQHGSHILTPPAPGTNWPHLARISP